MMGHSSTEILLLSSIFGEKRRIQSHTHDDKLNSPHPVESWLSHGFDSFWIHAQTTTCRDSLDKGHRKLVHKPRGISVCRNISLGKSDEGFEHQKP